MAPPEDVVKQYPWPAPGLKSGRDFFLAFSPEPKTPAT